MTRRNVLLVVCLLGGAVTEVGGVVEYLKGIERQAGHWLMYGGMLILVVSLFWLGVFALTLRRGITDSRVGWVIVIVASVLFIVFRLWAGHIGGGGVGALVMLASRSIEGYFMMWLGFYTKLRERFTSCEPVANHGTR